VCKQAYIHVYAHIYVYMYVCTNLCVCVILHSWGQKKRRTYVERDVYEWKETYIESSWRPTSLHAWTYGNIQFKTETCMLEKRHICVDIDLDWVFVTSYRPACLKIYKYSLYKRHIYTYKETHICGKRRTCVEIDLDRVFVTSYRPACMKVWKDSK